MRMNQGDALGTEVVIPHLQQQIRHPVGWIDHRQPAAVPQKMLSGSKQIEKGETHLMSCNGLLNIRVDASAVQPPIRRVAEGDVKRAGREMPVQFTQIHFDDVDSVLETIADDIVPGQLSELRLYLHSHDVPSETPVSECQGDHTAACTQIRHSVLAMDSGQTSQQDSVNGKPIASLLLLYDQFSAEESILCAGTISRHRRRFPREEKMDR